jgi:hypothetical protein
MDTVHIVSMIAGTTTNEVPITGELITYQMWPSGLLHVVVWEGGEVVEYYTFRRAEKITRTIDSSN